MQVSCRRTTMEEDVVFAQQAVNAIMAAPTEIECTDHLILRPRYHQVRQPSFHSARNCCTGHVSVTGKVGLFVKKSCFFFWQHPRGLADGPHG